MRSNPYNSAVRDFANFANTMNRAFGNNWSYDYVRNGGSNQSNGEQNVAKLRLPVDVWAKDEAYIITAYLPGVQPDAVEITLEGEELTIRGAFPKVEDAQFIKQELYRGAFERRLTFNVPVDADGIEAVYANGLLTLTVPKAEAVRPKQIKVVAK
ncbi:MAG: Hsp20/alpha crystallin family protein [Caldilineaceae bacterium]